MLIKTHRRHTVVQATVSIILHSGHTTKQVSYNGHLLYYYVLKIQVYCRLRKLGICLSSVATWSLIDKIGRNHDEIVKSWSHSLEKSIPTDHVSLFFFRVVNNYDFISLRAVLL